MKDFPYLLIQRSEPEEEFGDGFVQRDSDADDQPRDQGDDRAASAESSPKHSLKETAQSTAALSRQRDCFRVFNICDDGMQNGEKPEEKDGAPDGALESERRDALDLAKDQPQAKDQQADGKDVHAPAE